MSWCCPSHSPGHRTHMFSYFKDSPPQVHEPGTPVILPKTLEIYKPKVKAAWIEAGKTLPCMFSTLLGMMGLIHDWSHHFDSPNILWIFTLLALHSLIDEYHKIMPTEDIWTIRIGLAFYLILTHEKSFSSIHCSGLAWNRWASRGRFVPIWINLIQVNPRKARKRDDFLAFI